MPPILEPKDLCTPFSKPTPIPLLRAGDHAVHDGQRKDRKLALDEQKARLKEREVILAEEKFRNLLLEKLLETAKRPEVQAILQSTKPRAVKMEQLRLAIFGEEQE